MSEDEPMPVRTKERSYRGVPIKLPCGCFGVKSIGGNPRLGAGRSVILNDDGSRTCACGRQWVLVWKEA